MQLSSENTRSSQPLTTHGQLATSSLSSFNRKTSNAPKKDNFRWAKLSDLGALHEEDSTDEILSLGGSDSEDSEDSIADALEAMNKLLILDSPLDSPVDKNLDDLPLPESAESSFSISLSSVTTEDLTGFIIRDSEYPAHGGGYADVYTGTLSKEEKNTKVRKETFFGSI
ncbi:hypothetical protein CVT25_000268 [Psilocybe cyanescens]|uniref:Uncharacterized protein n=1 Tax=Psilocybe cyanescens TaxID=93625 RepID=A0A409XM05_PSICY|nr:hypothetical protein CVT25_000268 [Psilocybe cyanescens]